MNSGPIISRELRIESRRSLNFWLRVIGATAVSLVAAVGVFNPLLASPGGGGPLFYRLNATLFAGIWLIVPLLTADCISRERREGTLGLLFLTELTPSGVVLGKSLTHFLRAAMIFVAMLPVLVIPFLWGGLTWKDVATALFLNSGALLLSFSAGLLASVHARDHVHALILASLLGVFFAFAYMLLNLLLYGWLVRGLPISMGYGTWHYLSYAFENTPVAHWIKQLFSLATGLPQEPRLFGWAGRRGFDGWAALDGGWAVIWTSAPAAFQMRWIACSGLLFLIAACVATLTGTLAAFRVKQNWKDEPPSARRLWLTNLFCRPRLAKGLFQRRMRRSLDRNPIGWLQQYSWSARTTKWGWCLAFVIVESVLVTDRQLTNLWSGQYYMAVLLLASMALAAATSFRTERQTGALELLLVTPLSEWQIISGRLRGVWAQFLPAALVLAIAWLQLSKDAGLYSGGYSRTDRWQEICFPILFLSCYCFLPAIGLAMSVKNFHFLSAWITTAVLGIGIPLFFSHWLAQGMGLSLLGSIYWTFALQAACGLFAVLWLRHFLRERQFATVRAPGASPD